MNITPNDLHEFTGTENYFKTMDKSIVFMDGVSMLIIIRLSFFKNMPVGGGVFVAVEVLAAYPRAQNRWLPAHIASRFRHGVATTGIARLTEAGRTYLENRYADGRSQRLKSSSR